MDSRPRRSCTKPSFCGALILFLACTTLFSPQISAQAADTAGNPVAFRQAVELALQHSGVMGIAAMNQWRAHKVYQELRANYIPQVSIGSGLGYSYGFPLTLEGSAPSVVNFNSVQSFFNLALKHNIQAAKIDWKAASLDVQDKRDGVILDTALTYAQLEQVAGKIQTLNEANAAAEKAESISQQRLQEGVDSKLEVTRSQLVAARIRLRIAEAQDQSDVLRAHLANLLGVSAQSVALLPGSMPQLPAVSQDDDVVSRALSRSVEVKTAEQRAAAAGERATAEHRAVNMPTIDLASQYAYLAKFNNYDLYYRNYTANNFSGGLNLRIPIFNSVQKAKAEEADADSTIARKQVDLAKNQVSEQALKLQRSLRQLSAARDVAKLEWEVSQGDLEGVKVRVQSGSANTRDEQNAALDADDKRAAYLDSEFELSRAELQLLRLTGELSNWALPPQ